MISLTHFETHRDTHWPGRKVAPPPPQEKILETKDPSSLFRRQAGPAQAAVGALVGTAVTLETKSICEINILLGSFQDKTPV